MNSPLSVINNDASKFLLISDIHLGVNKNSAQKLNDIKKYLMDDVVNICNEQDIKNIIFLGDWFEIRESLNVNVINTSTKIIRHLNNNNIHIYMIIGNHDLYYRNRTDVHSLDYLKEHNNVTLIDNPTEFINGDHKYLMLPWGYNDLPENEKYDCIFGHLDIIGAKMQGMVNTSGFNPVTLTSIAPLVFSGHFHLSNVYDTKYGKIIMVGNPIQSAWGDYGNDKGVYILDTSTKKLEYSKILNKTSRIYRKIYWSDILAKRDDLTNIEGNYVKFIIDSDVKFEHSTKIINLINSKNPVSCEPEVAIQLKMDTDIKYSANDISDDIIEADARKQIEKYLEIIKNDGFIDKEKININILNSFIEHYHKRLII